jgi:hypothetical protein
MTLKNELDEPTTPPPHAPDARITGTCEKRLRPWSATSSTTTTPERPPILKKIAATRDPEVRKQLCQKLEARRLLWIEKRNKGQ